MPKSFRVVKKRIYCHALRVYDKMLREEELNTTYSCPMRFLAVRLVVKNKKKETPKEPLFIRRHRRRPRRRK